MNDSKVSKQREWQKRRIADGGCMTCGKTRNYQGSSVQCESCANKLRKRLGVSPWREGGRGRPPNSAKARAEGDGAPK